MAGMVTLTETYSVAGTYTWTAPAGVTNIQVECWGAGGGGAASSNGVFSPYFPVVGGGGGEYAAELAEAITAGNAYTVVVGAGGAGGPSLSAPGSAGGNSSFTGAGSTTVTANGGSGGTSSPTYPTLGGTGSTNSVHYNGGNANGGAHNSSYGGGGGGSSAGTTGPGNAGADGAPNLGGAGGAAPVGGGAGGNGGTSSACVTLDTTIYTRRGWVPYDELTLDDEALTVNIDTDTVEWAPILRINVHPGGWEMVEVHAEGFSACVTDQHRWLVLRDEVWKYAVLAELQPDDLIPLHAQLLRFGDCMLRATQADTVWCPTTGNGNWLASRAGTAYFIGNKP